MNGNLPFVSTIRLVWVGLLIMIGFWLVLYCKTVFTDRAVCRRILCVISDPSNYGELLIKRIVGVAGDWVTFPDRSHPDVYIRNGALKLYFHHVQ